LGVEAGSYEQEKENADWHGGVCFDVFSINRGLRGCTSQTSNKISLLRQ
jgi:hypothetical protein